MPIRVLNILYTNSNEKLIKKVIYNTIKVLYSIFKAWSCMQPYQKGSILHKKGFCYCYKPNTPFLVLFRTIFLKSAHIWRWEQLTEGQTSLQHFNDLGFMVVWPDSSLSSVKTTPLLGLQKSTQRTFTLWETRFVQSVEPQFQVSAGNQALLITCTIPSKQWSIVVAAASCCQGVFQQQRLWDLTR